MYYFANEHAITYSIVYILIYKHIVTSHWIASCLGSTVRWQAIHGSGTSTSSAACAMSSNYYVSNNICFIIDLIYAVMIAVRDM